ncbi:hypothetical protein F5I97DRAFT_698219 [Phlebopus sp. FC_14]|nr:hypothetical protein F5I97DRAFT_698219 [Phlebopus sp. FC_14]
MPMQAFNNRRPRQTTLPFFQTEQLLLGIAVSSDVPHYCQAVASALRQQSLPPVFDVVTLENQRVRYDTTGICDAPRDGATSIVLDLSTANGLQPSHTRRTAAELAVELGATVLLTVTRDDNDQHIVHVTFNVYSFRPHRASWLVFHIGHALRRMIAPQLRQIEQFLFPTADSHEEVDNSCLHVPKSNLLHTCFYERVKAMPLVPAIRLFDLPSNSSAVHVANITYVELFLYALEFVRKLQLNGVHDGDFVLLGRLPPHLAVIVTIALSMLGVACVPTEALDGAPSFSADTAAKVIITDDSHQADLPVGLPVIRPQRCVDIDILSVEGHLPKLPAVPEEKPYLLDLASQSKYFKSNADVHAALMENYRNFPTRDRMRVLYTDHKVNVNMLTVIWQILFVGRPVQVSEL